MPSAHYDTWAAYYAVEPFGEAAGNWQIAVIGSILARLLGGKQVTPESLMPGDRIKRKPATPENISKALIPRGLKPIKGTGSPNAKTLRLIEMNRGG